MLRKISVRRIFANLGLFLVVGLGGGLLIVGSEAAFGFTFPSYIPIGLGLGAGFLSTIWVDRRRR